MAVSWAIVESFNIDVIASLLSAYTGQVEDSTWLTDLMTALVIAGGSAGVNRVLVGMGVREQSSEPPKEATVERTEAWISVTVRRSGNIAGAVRVSGTPAADATADAPALAGTTHAAQPGLLTLLLRAYDRFPPEGGYRVTTAQAYRIAVHARTRDGNEVSKNVVGAPVKFAPGAVVDLEVTI